MPRLCAEPVAQSPVPACSMNILVFGKTGQLATALQQLAPGAQYLGRDDADLTDPGACAAAMRRANVDVVINAAAYTAVDRAESEPKTAILVSSAAPAAMARAAADRGLPFLHVSSDYVFDGSGSTPWPVDAPIGPLGVYGRTKREGEADVRAAAGPHAILRTSWVFSAHGANFLKTMLRLGRTRTSLSVVADQIGGPTSAADIPTTAYPTPAQRRLNSRLDCSTMTESFGIAQLNWRTSPASVLKNLGEFA